MRSQVSTETIFLISIVLIIFILTALFTFSKRAQIEETGSFIEKRNECNKIATAINYLKINGPGTKARLNTNFLVETRDNTVIIKDIKNTTTIKNEIAIMASSTGVTQQSFYDKATAKFNPDWYDNCYEGQELVAEIAACHGFPSPGEVNFLTITWNYTQLMKNISRYNTVYLEDAHTNTTLSYNGKTFIDIQEDWVKDGGVLILSEHYMCRYNVPLCTNPNNTMYDWYNLFGVNMHNIFGSNIWATVIEEDPFFPGLSLGSQTQFAEFNWVEDYSQNNDAENIKVIERENVPNSKNSPATGRSAFAYWKYGNGLVIYLSDFQNTSLSDVSIDEVLINVIENAFIELITAEESSEVFCHSELSLDKNYRVTGKIELENVNKTITIKNYE